VAKRQFNYVFEDIRRNSSPVRSDGFGNDVQAGDDVDVDLNEEDQSKAVTRSSKTAVEDEGAERGQKPRKQPAKKDQQRDQRRDVLAARRAGKEAAESSIASARAETATEVSALRKEVAELKGRDELANAEAEYATKKADIEAQLAIAMEGGKHADYARLNSQLIELNNDLQRKRLEVKAKSTTAQVDDLNAQRGKAPLKRIKEFLDNNSDWWADPEHEEAVDYAKSLDMKLTKELGLDPNSDAYWEKFNKSFDKKFDGLRVRSDDEDDPVDDDDTRGSSKRVVTPPTKGSGGGGKQQRQQQQRSNDDATPTKVTLTAADKANMRQFGLDPSNEEHLVEYARNKVPDDQE
jgi:hypothetical protein